MWYPLNGRKKITTRCNYQQRGDTRMTGRSGRSTRRRGLSVAVVEHANTIWCTAPDVTMLKNEKQKLACKQPKLKPVFSTTPRSVTHTSDLTWLSGHLTKQHPTLRRRHSFSMIINYFIHPYNHLAWFTIQVKLNSNPPWCDKTMTTR
jgi:hypothetical protein